MSQRHPELKDFQIKPISGPGQAELTSIFLHTCALHSSEAFLVMRNRIQECLAQLKGVDYKEIPTCVGTQEPKNRIGNCLQSVYDTI